MEHFAGTKTIIIYGNDKPYDIYGNKKPYEFAKHVLNILHFNVEELVVIGKAPAVYFASMSVNARKNIKFLRLISYSGQYLKKPCSVFPHLEELTLEDSRINEISTKACVRLTKIWIRENAVTVRVVSSLLSISTKFSHFFLFSQFNSN